MWVLVSQRYSFFENSLTPRSVSLRESDSGQCYQPVQSLIPRIVSLRRVTYFANISAKTNISAKPFQLIQQRSRWVSFIEKKNAKKSRDTDTLKPNCDRNFSKSKNWFINMSCSRYYVTLHKSHPCPILTSAHLKVHSELWGNSAEYWNRNRELVFIDKNIL